MIPKHRENIQRCLDNSRHWNCLGDRDLAVRYILEALNMLLDAFPTEITVKPPVKKRKK